MKRRRTLLQDGFQKNQWRFVKDEGKNNKQNSAVAVFECLVCHREMERMITQVVSLIRRVCMEKLTAYIIKPKEEHKKRI
jgi:hypothetical protein